MNYKLRREKLYNLLGNEGVLLLSSGFEVHRSADECYPFSVNRNFYYLTGVDQKDSYLLVDLKTRKEELFLLETDPLKARWIGEYLDFKEVQKMSQIENIRPLKEFDEALKSTISNNGDVYLDLEKVIELGGLHYDEYFLNLVKSINDKINVHDVYNHIISLRAIKDDDEIQIIRKAIDLTNEGLRSVLKELKTMNNERQVQGLFEHVIFENEKGTPSFDTIVGGGKNSTILHYHSNNEDFNTYDIVLLDLGARLNYYNADISRSYPHGGVYTELQKTIYNIVLKANENVMILARPGVSMRFLQEKTIELLSELCLKEGLISSKEEIKDVYFHSVSHHLGLDVHDPMGRDTILEKGNVITDEPGLYFSKYNIGVRIEDDLLITEDGCENLSKDILKNPTDIELFMKGEELFEN